jgi:hypothetical protein
VVGEVSRARLLRLGRVAFAAVLLVVLVVVAGRHVDELREVDLDPSLQWLLAAAPFTFAGGVLLPLAWRETVAAYGTSLPRSTALRVWCVSQASRFIPGNVALVASRVVLAAREGVSKKTAAFTLALEVGFVVVWGGFFASWLPSTRIAGPLRLLLAIGCLGALAAAPLVLRLVRLYEAVGLYGLNNLATATVLLAPTVGAGNAAAIAVAMRAFDFLFELVWIAIALAWERRQAAARIGT